MVDGMIRQAFGAGQSSRSIKKGKRVAGDQGKKRFVPKSVISI